MDSFRRTALLLGAVLLLSAMQSADAAQRDKAAGGKSQKPAGESLCPPAIKVEARLQEVPKGWEMAEASRPHALAYVTFHQGPPTGQSSLKFDREEKARARMDRNMGYAAGDPRLLDRMRLYPYHVRSQAPLA